MKDALEKVMFTKVTSLLNLLNEIAKAHNDIPMMCRTHGQSATPSTMGKEIANFVYRVNKQF